MLSDYIKSDSYDSMIEKAVDSTEEFKEYLNKFEDALDTVDCDRKTYDSIDQGGILMMIKARDMAYEKGFRDGVRFIINCMASGKEAVI